MLPLRLVIFAALGGIALWSLFSLLDALRAPELLRSPKAVVVKGCDPIESDDAVRLCPPLFCQKALLDARVVPLRTTFNVSTDKRAGSRQLIAGSAIVEESSPPALFACVLEGDNVAGARLIDASLMSRLAAEGGDWTLGP